MVKKNNADKKVETTKNDRWPFFAPYLRDKRVNGKSFDLGKPFDHCDFSGRDVFAQNIINIVESYKTRGAVIGLDAGWGYGKSTFMDMLGCEMEVNKGFTVVRFNAWQTDFASDPLLAFIAEFANELRDGFNRYNVKYLLSMLDSLTDVGVKVAMSSPVVEAQVAGNVIKSFKWLRNVHKEASRQVYDKYIDEKKVFKDFKKKLEELATANLKASKGKLDNNGKPIIVLIDELDRCRPDYAIKLLENIKHFFDIPGIVFVLAVNRGQLENSFRHVYGGKEDEKGEVYFEKFVDNFIPLPGPNLKSLVASLYEADGINAILEESFIDGQPEIKEVFSTFMSHFAEIVSSAKEKDIAVKTSPREMEKVVKYVFILLRQRKEYQTQWHLYVLGFFCFFIVRRHTNSEFFKFEWDKENIISAFGSPMNTLENKIPFLYTNNSSSSWKRLFWRIGDSQGILQYACLLSLIGYFDPFSNNSGVIKSNNENTIGAMQKFWRSCNPPVGGGIVVCNMPSDKLPSKPFAFDLIQLVEHTLASEEQPQTQEKTA